MHSIKSQLISSKELRSGLGSAAGELLWSVENCVVSS